MRRVALSVKIHPCVPDKQNFSETTALFFLSEGGSPFLHFEHLKQIHGMMQRLLPSLHHLREIKEHYCINDHMKYIIHRCSKLAISVPIYLVLLHFKDIRDGYRCFILHDRALKGKGARIRCTGSAKKNRANNATRETRRSHDPSDLPRVSKEQRCDSPSIIRERQH